MNIKTNLLEDILDELIFAELGDVIQADSSYITSRIEILNLEKKYQTLDLTENQREVIEHYIDNINENGAIYGDLAYKIGFRHCVILLRELDVIR